MTSRRRRDGSISARSGHAARRLLPAALVMIVAVLASGRCSRRIRSRAALGPGRGGAVVEQLALRAVRHGLLRAGRLRLRSVQAARLTSGTSPVTSATRRSAPALPGRRAPADHWPAPATRPGAAGPGPGGAPWRGAAATAGVRPRRCEPAPDRREQAVAGGQKVSELVAFSPGQWRAYRDFGITPGPARRYRRRHRYPMRPAVTVTSTPDQK